MSRGGKVSFMRIPNMVERKSRVEALPRDREEDAHRLNEALSDVMEDFAIRVLKDPDVKSQIEFVFMNRPHKEVVYLISALTRYHVPLWDDLRSLLRQNMTCESKYMFMASLQCLLRSDWARRDALIADLSIPEDRKSLATNLIKVLEEVLS